MSETHKKIEVDRRYDIPFWLKIGKVKKIEGFDVHMELLFGWAKKQVGYLVVGQYDERMVMYKHKDRSIFAGRDVHCLECDKVHYWKEKA